MHIRLAATAGSLLAALLAAPAVASPTPGLLDGLLGVVGTVNTQVIAPILDLGAAPPPTFLQTLYPSPQCANINGGELLCCRNTVAGDNQLVVWLGELYGYPLNPNDVNGIDCDNTTTNACPGVNLCCQTTFLTPILAQWCQSA